MVCGLLFVKAINKQRGSKMDTIQYLDAVKARYHWESDYKLAKEMGLSQSRMSNYRCGKTEMDENLCIDVANLLKLNPAKVLIDITAERTKCDKAAQILRKTAKQLTSAAASLFLTLSMIYGTIAPAESMANCIVTVCDNVYYVKYIIDWIIASDSTKSVFFTLFLLNQLFLRCLLHLLIIAKKSK
jgi:transcriptional regulator with XRE-family HTH domain